jgi:hypothetical protein
MGVELTAQNYSWGVHFLPFMWLTKTPSEIIGNYVVLNDITSRTSDGVRQDTVGTSVYSSEEFHARYEFIDPEKDRNIPQHLRKKK